MELGNISPCCFVCNEETYIFRKNIQQISAKHTDTKVSHLLEKFLGQDISEEVLEASIICQSCLDKINEYDLAISTSHHVQKDISEMLAKTHKLGSEMAYEIKYELENDVDIDNEISDEESYETISYDILPVNEKLATMKCNICNALFTSLSEMQAHKHDKDIEILEEEEVKLEEVDVEDYKSNIKHIKYMPDDNILYTSEIEYIEETVIEVSEEKESDETAIKTRRSRPKTNIPSACGRCNIEFKSKSEHKLHMKLHDDYDKYVCDICGITYKTKSGLDVHVGLHKGLSPHECAVCHKKFTQKGALVRHMPIHSGEKPYQCDKCGKRFLHYSSFHMHQLAHDNIREKKCSICGFELRSNSHLTRHMRVHSGEKPFECPTCGQKFAQRYNMMTHYKSHQGIHRIYNKIHTCTSCSASFTKKAKLDEHIATKHGADDDSSDKMDNIE